MNYIQWIHRDEVMAGTTLRDPSREEDNNMALHTGGDLQAIIRNRKALSEELNVQPEQWVFSQQTHSDHIYKVTSADAGKGFTVFEEGIADCDALYTREKNIAIGVFHADCVPVLLYDPVSELIAAIHSGWQGTVKEITKKTLQHLIEEEHVDPANLLAYIGPAISYRSFEVGRDVSEQVEAMSFDTTSYIHYLRNDKALVNNKGLNKQMLIDLGVPRNNISINRSDTFMKNDSLFSYRRDHACGRHLSFIVMK